MKGIKWSKALNPVQQNFLRTDKKKPAIWLISFSPLNIISTMIMPESRRLLCKSGLQDTGTRNARNCMNQPFPTQISNFHSHLFLQMLSFWTSIKTLILFHKELTTLTLYQTTKFRLVKIENICRWHNKCVRKIEIAVGKGRKHCGKRRKCWLPAFSPFPSMFSKGFLYRVVKSWDCMVKR